jgi:hypothetical protein
MQCSVLSRRGWSTAPASGVGRRPAKSVPRVSRAAWRHPGAFQVRGRPVRARQRGRPALDQEFLQGAAKTIASMTQEIEVRAAQGRAMTDGGDPGASKCAPRTGIPTSCLPTPDRVDGRQPHGIPGSVLLVRARGAGVPRVAELVGALTWISHTIFA